eukprot:COSAG06_NODE_29304_length_559_cov_0.676087_1_plen_63_part_01
MPNINTLVLVAFVSRMPAASTRSALASGRSSSGAGLPTSAAMRCAEARGPLGGAVTPPTRSNG